jgi:hypothetical protein
MLILTTAAGAAQLVEPRCVDQHPLDQPAMDKIGYTIGQSLFHPAAAPGTAAGGARESIVVPVPPTGADFSLALATFPEFLEASQLAALKEAVERVAGIERSYLPTHKKGGTIAYETLIAQAPVIAAFYQSAAMCRFVSSVVGVKVQPTPLHDQSSLSVLVYDRPGDHIGWHYDHNFYRGRHFTVLLPIINAGSDANGLSHARLVAKLAGVETEISTPPNKLVIFEGARVVHKVQPIIAGERRVLISMTYCADPRAKWWQEVARRFKDIAFFGPRALWS